MKENWCICNNTGIIIIPAINVGCKTSNGELGLYCPICKEFDKYFSLDEIIEIIKLSKINNEPISRFRMNPHYVDYLVKQYYLPYDDIIENNLIYGVSVKLDMNIHGIEIDYV